ncbi:hypothetical protein GC330_01940 [Yersinia pestis]|nr:hypothetical protein A1122_02995 [Yersinia pestis A1122]ANW15849.1 hypothetical protein BAY22_18825 [Yersinia pestis]EKS48186.1 hypothetical protein INS_02150 [Yersinia pestis INS]ERP78689.1 hypothetical protein L328_02085 [Yersinia pestis 24H]ERP79798.1 hypothetical protein L326_02075 [Yersinia pestis 113]ERP84412.1 hypothetical protein L325_02065 [Yersinia pestis 9]KKM50307.1 hypothetical protein KD37_13575 [Yersinia pestis subsp. pestis bv. Orientalis]
MSFAALRVIELSPVQITRKLDLWAHRLFRGLPINEKKSRKINGEKSGKVGFVKKNSPVTDRGC